MFKYQLCPTVTSSIINSYQVNWQLSLQKRLHTKKNRTGPGSPMSQSFKFSNKTNIYENSNKKRQHENNIFSFGENEETK